MVAQAHSAAVVNLTPAHLARLQAVEEQCFSNPWSEADFIQVLMEPRAVRLGLLVDGRLVGFTLGYVDGPEFHLANLAVEPAVRRQGWGSDLLRRILAQARQLGCRWCSLEVRESNQAAVALYAGLGFRQTGRRLRYYSRPAEDALLLWSAIEKY